MGERLTPIRIPKLRGSHAARGYARYHSLPKDFVGPEQADDLFNLHTAMRQATHSSGYLFAAGSAAAEAALIGYDTPVDERHYRLEQAESAWTEAQLASLRRHMWYESSETKLYTFPSRVEMNKIFLPLYHDMVDGFVQKETMSRTYVMLARLAMDNLLQHDIAFQNNDASFVQRRGLGYELGSLIAPDRLQCPSFFAIPAIARADTGNHFPHDTHDVRLIRQSWGVIEDVIQYEVKPTEKASNARYHSATIRAHIDLEVPTSANPLEYARLAYREATLTASLDDIAILDEITSKVLRRAEHYTKSLGALSITSIPG